LPFSLFLSQALFSLSFFPSIFPSSHGLMKKRAAGVFQLIKHIYKTTINDFHAIFQSDCRHYLTILPNFNRSKILTVYESICEEGPR